MPPVRDDVSTQDPRVIALAVNNRKAARWKNARPAVNNRKAARWKNARPGERKVTSPVPRALRAKGYEPVASLISAWVGKRIDVGTVRSWWRFDLAREESSYLPPPDAVIKRKGGTLLPGWADETIREWLSGRGGERNWETYLAWDAENDEIDPSVISLIAGNQARDIRAISQPRRQDAVPAAYLALGYKFVSQVITANQERPVNEYTVCTYWREDILRNSYQPNANFSDAYSRRLPVPDAIISRGSRGDLLPGWTESTIKAWVPTRPGPGNRTSEGFRIGFDKGRTGMQKIGVDADGRDKFARVADLAGTVPA